MKGIENAGKCENVKEKSMKKVLLKELGFNTRDEAIAFIKKLWNQENVDCPICESRLELLHIKAKKSILDWQCKNCVKTFKTIYLLDEINEQMPN